MKKTLTVFLIIGLVVPCFSMAIEKQPPAIDYIWSWVKVKAELVWDKIYYYLSLKVEERTPTAEQEFKRELEELKEEIKEETPSLWQRFKGFFY